MSSGLIEETTAEQSSAVSHVGLEYLRATSVKTKRDTPPSTEELATFSSAQEAWAARPVRERLRVLRSARHQFASRVEELADTISPALARSRADTLVAEVLPLLDACKFLERQAEALLRPKRLGRTGRPFWLSGTRAEVHRVPLGRVLVIGPGNFPLFLPGVQVLQALAAGNAVVWKPGVGGAAVARLFAGVLRGAGLPAGILHVTDETVESATAAIQSKPDKVIFTGSSQTGRRILKQLAPNLTPAVLELSGTDALLVLESANLQRVSKAIAFGLRLNGGAVCMSPRRLLGTARTLSTLLPLLREELARLPPVHLEAHAAERLETGLATAALEGGQVEGVVSPHDQCPILLHDAQPSMHITREAYFAPVLALMKAKTDGELATLHNKNPYALTVSIFGDEAEARALASEVHAGSVLINDLIAPTADPRLPFGGRAESGFGVTRGAEGLLEMTAIKVIQTRTNSSTRHYEATGESDVPFFAALVRSVHARNWKERFHAIGSLAKAMRQRAKP